MKNLRRLFSREAAPESSESAHPPVAPAGSGPGRRRRSGRSTRRSGRRMLMSESLEQRQLLASDWDFASIAGPDFQVAYSHNYHMAADVDSNYKVTALDALLVINALNDAGGPKAITGGGQFTYMVDVDGNNQLTALDALRVINELNRGSGEENVPDLVSFGITPRTLGDEQLLTIPDPEPDPIFGGPNATSGRFQTPRPAGPREANVQVGDIFKLEVQTQDLRGFSALGVFQVANDIIIDSKGVLEPVASEVQTFVFDSSIRGSGGDVQFFFADDPNNVVTRTRAEVFGVPFVQQTAAAIAGAINELDPSIATTDVSISGINNPTGTNGPSGGGSFTVTVRYTGNQLINADVPLLTIRPTDPAVAQPIVFEANVRDENGEFSDTALLSNLELISRNVDPAVNPNGVIIFGAERRFGSFDELSTGDSNVDISQVDIFNEIGAIGPTATFVQFLTPTGNPAPPTTFDPGIGYDSYAIPVRAVRQATNVRVFLDPADVGETVLLYGQQEGKDQAQVEQIELGERSSFILNVLPADGPVNAGNGTLTVNENDADGESINVANLVTVADGTTPTITVDTAGIDGTVNFDGTTLTFIPTAGTVGTQTIPYTATAGANSATGAITVTVANVNDPPVAVNDLAQIDVNANASITIDVLANDSAGANDPEALTITGVSDVTGGATVNFSSGTNIVFTPAAGSTGTETFTYTISDGTSTASAMVTVTVVDNATGPVVQTPRTVTVAEDSGETQVIDLETLVTPDGVAGRVFTITQPAVGTARLDAGTSLLFYTPPANVFGTASATIPFTVTDPEGTASAGSQSGVISVNITPVNDNPVANPDSATVGEGGTVTIPVLANDNAGPLENDTLTVSAVTQPAAGGVASISADGTQVVFRSTGTASATPVTFTYTVSDGAGGTATANVSVTVTDVLDNPIAADAPLSGPEDGGNLTLNLLTLVTLEGNDTVTFSLVSGGTGPLGTASITGNTLTFVPAANANNTTAGGPQSIVYRATSTRTGPVASDTGTITVSLTPTNDAPTGNNFSVALNANGGATFNVAARLVQSPTSTAMR